MRRISTFEAKTKLSEVIKAATNGQPQVITNNGVEKVVVISIEEYRGLTNKKNSLNDFFINSPLRNSHLDLTRSKDIGRATLNFGDESE